MPESEGGQSDPNSTSKKNADEIQTDSKNNKNKKVAGNSPLPCKVMSSALLDGGQKVEAHYLIGHLNTPLI